MHSFILLLYKYVITLRILIRKAELKKNTNVSINVKLKTYFMNAQLIYYKYKCKFSLIENEWKVNKNAHVERRTVVHIKFLYTFSSHNINLSARRILVFPLRLRLQTSERNKFCISFEILCLNILKIHTLLQLLQTPVELHQCTHYQLLFG